MEIAQIISNIQTPKPTIARFKYNIEFNKVKNVWFEIAKKIIGKNPVLTEERKHVWSEIIKYIYATPGCEFDLNKGLYICGLTGTGKTSTFDIISSLLEIDNIQYERLLTNNFEPKKNYLSKFNFIKVSSKQILKEFTEGSYSAIQKYIDARNVFIDDLGAESTTAKHYGSELNVMVYLIEERYLHTVGFTHFTSNYPLSHLSEIYDTRVFSRLCEMCNVVKLTDGGDLRVDEKIF